MTLVGTSIWGELLRGTTAATAFVRDNVGDGLVTSEPILMELLAGARPPAPLGAGLPDRRRGTASQRRAGPSRRDYAHIASATGLQVIDLR